MTEESRSFNFGFNALLLKRNPESYRDYCTAACLCHPDARRPGLGRRRPGARNGRCARREAASRSRRLSLGLLLLSVADFPLLRLAAPQILPKRRREPFFALPVLGHGHQMTRPPAPFKVDRARRPPS